MPKTSTAPARAAPISVLRPRRVQAVTRAIDVAMALRDGPRRLTEISRATGLSKGTAFRLVQTLSYRSLIFKDPDTDLYMLGPGALGLMQGVLLGLGGVVAGRSDALRKLQEASGETIGVHVRIGMERVCIYELPSINPLRYTLGIGASSPLHAGAAGKAILAMLPDDEVERILSRLGMPRVTQRTIVDRKPMMAELERTREQGYATSTGEAVPGACAVSVGFSAVDGTLAVVSVYGPETRIPPARYPELVRGLQRAARNLTESLSGPKVAGKRDGQVVDSVSSHRKGTGAKRRRIAASADPGG
jgi:IclR family acetate operon transcriptional repressor